MKTKTTVFYDDNDVQSFSSVKNYLFETFAEEEGWISEDAASCRFLYSQGTVRAPSLFCPWIRSFFWQRVFRALRSGFQVLTRWAWALRAAPAPLSRAPRPQYRVLRIRAPRIPDLPAPRAPRIPAPRAPPLLFHIPRIRALRILPLFSCIY